MSKLVQENGGGLATILGKEKETLPENYLSGIMQEAGELEGLWRRVNEGSSQDLEEERSLIRSGEEE